MYPRTNYEMTEEDLAEIQEACKPTPVMLIGGSCSPSPQENANRAWRRLGEKMGFDYMTVHPIPGKGPRFFTAVPAENEERKKERLAREVEEQRKAEIAHIEGQIIELMARLDVLKKAK